MGVGSANVVFLPIANRLKAISAEEVELRMMTLEGILSIQAGDNPRLVAEKLSSYLPPRSARARPHGCLGARGAAGRGGLEMARGSNGRGHQEHESEERWLLTYADMITLLMALFMVLFSISALNISKYRTLRQALRAAFSGQVLPGGKSIENAGATANSSKAPTAADIETIVPITTLTSSNLENSPGGASTRRVKHRQCERRGRCSAGAEHFEQIQHRIQAYAHAHGLGKYVTTTIENRGLVIRILTDKLLFNSGSASLNPGAGQLIDELAHVINVDQVHPVAVDGNTDNQPIQSSDVPATGSCQRRARAPSCAV